MASGFQALKKVKGGWKVFAKSTHEPLSKHPLPYRRALAQLRAIQFYRHRGQGQIPALIIMILALIVYGALYPLLIQTISDMSLTGATALIGNLIPFMILLGILLIPLKWSQQSQQPQQ